MSKTNGFVSTIDLLRNETGGTLAVDETAVVYTETYVCQPRITYGIEYQFTSSGSVNCKVEVEQGNTAPATEGAADSNFAVPESTIPLAIAVTDELVHIKAYSPVVTRFLRLKITGLTGNHTSTVLSRATIASILNV